MATSNTEENIKQSDKSGHEDSSEDSSSFSDDSDMECSGGEPSSAGDKPGSVSIFCKSCFTPYSGVQKSDTFVLKCQVCGLTDTVHEEQATGLDTGNLMMNRFFKVLRATENLNVNISDPDFADDNYMGINGAMKDFCVYLNCMTTKLLEIAQEEKRGLEKNLSILESGSPGAAVEGGADMDDKMNNQNEMVIREDTFNEILAHRDSVVDVIAFLIEKYNLPEDIWASLERRLDNPNSETDGSDKDDNEITDAENKAVISADPFDIVKPNLSAKKGEMSGLVGQRDESDDGLVKDGERGEDEAGGEREKIFGMQIEDVRAKLDDEINGKLRSKFDLGDKDDSDNDTSLEFGGSKTESDKDPTIAGEISKLWATKFTFRQRGKSNIDPLLETLLKNTNIIRETFAACRAKSNGAENDGNDVTVKRKHLSRNAKRKDRYANKFKAKDKTADRAVTPSSDDPESDGFEVNFRDISQAFVDELQGRKKDILKARKEKAKTMLAAQIAAIKQQVRGVERSMRKELHYAFKEKKKRAKTQRKNLTDRQKEIESVEEQLRHCVATGQQDKIAELMTLLESLTQRN